MIFALPFIIAGLILAVMAHLTSVLLMPHFTRNDIFARLGAVAAVNTAAALPQREIDRLGLPFADPAAAAAVCRYDLSAGILRVRAPAAETLLTVTIAAKGGRVFYSLTDRAAAGDSDSVDVVIGTPEQIAKIEAADPEDEAVSELRVRAPKNEGVVIFRVLALTDSGREAAERAAAASTCELEALDEAQKGK